MYSDMSSSQMSEVARICMSKAGEQDCVSIEAVSKLITSGRLSQVEQGRHYVGLSLAEAETIRRIIHLRNASAQQSWKAVDQRTAISLRCFSGGSFITDQSKNYADVRLSDSSYTLQSVFECFRFFNCDMFFSESALYTLLKSLHVTTRRERRNFFKSILICRRRLNKKWRSTPISKVFVIADQFKMLKQKSFSLRVCNEIAKKGLLMYDAFCKFDFDRNGLLSPGEIWGGFDYLGIPMVAEDVLDFLHAGDIDRYCTTHVACDMRRSC